MATQLGMRLSVNRLTKSPIFSTWFQAFWVICLAWGSS